MLSSILYVFIWLVSFLPLRILYGFSDVLYYFVYYVFAYRKKVVRTNLRNSFPEKTEAELRSVERKYYRNLCDFFVEMYKTWHMSEKEMRKRCVFRHTEILQDYFDRGKSVIGVLGHYGNWEWMSSFSLWMKGDVSFYTIYKPIHDKVMDQMMRRIRSRFGSVPVPKKEIFRRLARDRQEGRLFLAGFIGDQTPDSGNLNFWMEFLHQDTPVLVGTERIARKLGLSVISLRMHKVRRGYYEVDFLNLCEDVSGLAPGELTRMHTRLLEEQIVDAPEYWLWSHRRWKHKRKLTEEETKGRMENK